jgi:hypothetical protein
MNDERMARRVNQPGDIPMGTKGKTEVHEFQAVPLTKWPRCRWCTKERDDAIHSPHQAEVAAGL